MERSEGVVGWVWKAARVWICVDGVGGWMVAVLYSVHVQVYEVGCAVEVDRVGFESSCNFLYESGVEVEGVAGLQVAGVNSLSLG